MKATGVCPWCGAAVPLRKDGKVGAHRRSSIRSRYTGALARARVKCAGGGRAPVEPTS